jgi:hypothetical protein
MPPAAQPPAELRTARVILVAGFAGAALLMAAALFLYPINPARATLYAAGVAGGIVLLLGLGACVGTLGLRARSEVAQVLRQGIIWGACFGALWVVEISYNNVLAQPIVIRDPVDNVFWAFIALGMLALAARAAWRSRGFSAGVRAGFWSGLVSGLMACLAALTLVVFGMRLLLADPVNIAEWADRGPTGAFPTMATYFAYQTIAGAMLEPTLRTAAWCL